MVARIGGHHMYFSLNNTSYYVNGQDGASLYDLKQETIKRVPQEFVDELFEINKGKKVDTQSSIYPYLLILKNEGLGYFHEKRIYQEEFRSGLPRDIDTFLNSKVRVFNLYLQVQGKCNLKCNYCKNESSSNRMTGCREYKDNIKLSDISNMEKALYESSKLGCKTVHILGGEPLLNKDVVRQLFNKAIEYKFENIYLYTNALLIDEDDISLFTKEVKAIIHVDQFNQNLISKIELLKKNSIPYYFNICFHINNFKQKNEILNMATKLSPNGFVSSYIFDNLDDKNYYNEIIGSLNENTLFTNEHTFFNNMRHHPCLYGKITVFSDGKIGVCPMMPNNIIGHIREEKISDILIEKKHVKYWNKSLSELEKCGNCSLRFGCNDCLAVEQYINAEKKFICPKRKEMEVIDK